MPRLYSEATEKGNGRPVFEHLDPRAAAKLTELGIEARFQAGDLIFRPHDESGQFYFVRSGSVAIEQPGTDRAVRIQTLHAGDFLGWSALLGEGTRHFQARALRGTVLLTFDGSLIRRTCEDDPRFGCALMKRLLFVATERLDATRNQIVEMQKGYVRDWASAAGA